MPTCKIDWDREQPAGEKNNTYGKQAANAYIKKNVIRIAAEGLRLWQLADIGTAFVGVFDIKQGVHMLRPLVPRREKDSTGKPNPNLNLASIPMTSKWETRKMKLGLVSDRLSRPIEHKPIGGAEENKTSHRQLMTSYLYSGQSLPGEGGKTDDCLGYAITKKQGTSQDPHILTVQSQTFNQFKFAQSTRGTGAAIISRDWANVIKETLEKLLPEDGSRIHPHYGDAEAPEPIPVQPRLSRAGSQMNAAAEVDSAGQPKTNLNAPLVYGPAQNLPSALLTLVSGRSLQEKKKIVGPPVYRPQLEAKATQAKMGGAPPVYRPFPSVQPVKAKVPSMLSLGRKPAPTLQPLQAKAASRLRTGKEWPATRVGRRPAIVPPPAQQAQSSAAASRAKPSATAQPKMAGSPFRPAVPLASCPRSGQSFSRLPRSAQRSPIIQAKNVTPQSCHVIQRLTNKHNGDDYAVEMGEGKIELVDLKTNSKGGFAEHFIKDSKFYLKTIDTKSSAAPKGAGAMLVYQLASLARNRGIMRIMVTNATPEETGFYTHMGFEPDPDFLQELQKSGMSNAQIEKVKNTTLSGNVHTLLDQAGASVVKNWTDLAWAKQGLYAGDHPVHGEMFHIPL